MNLVCPGCQSTYPLPGHVQLNHPFNCPRCRYSGSVGAILSAASAAPAPTSGGFAMPGPPHGHAPAPASGGFQMPGPPQGGGFQMPGPPQSHAPAAAGFQMPGPPQGHAPAAAGFQMPGPPQSGGGFQMPGPPQGGHAQAPQAVPVTLVNPAQSPAAPAPQLGLADGPDMGWQDRSGVMSGEVNGAMALVDDDMDWKPRGSSSATPSLDLAEPDPPARSPAGGGALELDLADEPEPEVDPDCDGFDPVDEDVPLSEEDGGWDADVDADVDDDGGDDDDDVAGGFIGRLIYREVYKRFGWPGVVVLGLGAAGLSAVVGTSGGDDDGPRSRRGKVAARDAGGSEGGADGEDGGEGAPSKPKPKPDLGLEQVEEAKETAAGMVAKKEFLEAIQCFRGLPKDVQYKHGRVINPQVDALSKQAAEHAKAEATALLSAGKPGEAMAFLTPYLDQLKGRPRGSLNSLERQLKRAIQTGVKPTPAPQPSPSATARPTASPSPEATPIARRPTPQPSPSPRRRFRPWTPKPAAPDAELLKDVPKGKIKKTKHYVIVSTADEAFTKQSASMLESVRRGFYRFFDKKGFATKQHEGPLVAYVFGNEEDYRAIGGKQGLSVPGNAAGFYHTKTNALYFRDTRNTPMARQVKAQIKKYEDHLKKLRKDKDKAKGSNKTRYSDFIREQAKKLRKYKRKNKKFLESANDSLTIHEAVHQLCYNAGILTPSDLNPEWVVEGLAMLFEEEAVWKGKAGRGVPSRIRTLKRRAKDGKRMTVRDLVGSNQQLISRGDAGLAYSSAWALIHMFVRGKFRKYKHPFLAYLKGIQKRSREAGWEVRGAEASDERIKRFEEAFGKIDKLEPEYKAYIDKLIK